MPQEYLTVSEFAKLAGVSRQVVYKQLTGRLSTWVTVVDNHKMIDCKALKLYGVNIPEESADIPNNSNDLNEINKSCKVDNTVDKLVDTLTTELEMLRKQLNTKDKQIDLLLTQNQTLADTLHQTQEQLSAAQALHAGTIQQQLTEQQPQEESKTVVVAPDGEQIEVEGKHSSWFSRLFR